MVRSTIVAYDFDPKVNSYVRQRAEMENKEIKLVRYGCSNNIISLAETKQFGTLNIWK